MSRSPPSLVGTNRPLGGTIIAPKPPGTSAHPGLTESVDKKTGALTLMGEAEKDGKFSFGGATVPYKSGDSAESIAQKLVTALGKKNLQASFTADGNGGAIVTAPTARVSLDGSSFETVGNPRK